jgi:hypothetical protein
MPQARVMPELIQLPDMSILIVNGAQTGVAGYGNVRLFFEPSERSDADRNGQVANQVGASNADNPAFQPVRYDPSAPAGSRFSSAGIPASTIARMYHSTASLTPNGTILLGTFLCCSWFVMLICLR